MEFILRGKSSSLLVCAGVALALPVINAFSLQALAKPVAPGEITPSTGNTSGPRR